MDLLTRLADTVFAEEDGVETKRTLDESYDTKRVGALC